jgi:hypothetical protein
MTTYREFLSELWACSLFDSMRSKDGNIYGENFLNKQRDYAKNWISNPKKLPGRANIRLRSKNKCVYCKNELTENNGYGDHVESGFEDRGILWTVPCERSCNSSKGKKDLIVWWCEFKGNSIIDLSRDVISIFVRAKYRHLENIGELNNEIPEIYYTALEQIKNNWSVKGEIK